MNPPGERSFGIEFALYLCNPKLQIASQIRIMYGSQQNKGEYVIYAQAHKAYKKTKFCQIGMITVYPGCWGNNLNDTLCSETAVPSITIKCAKTRVAIQKGLWESQ